MPKRVSFSHLNPLLVEIKAHHSDLEAALKAYYGFSPYGRLWGPKFAYYTKKEVLEEYKKRIDELDRTSCFTLLSSLEASFRIDYLKWCYEKRKDELSRDFRAKHQNLGSRASLEGDILTAWKERHPELGSLISELFGVLKYRHWLAHGRYWGPKLGRKFDYTYVLFIVEQTYQQFPFLH